MPFFTDLYYFVIVKTCKYTCKKKVSFYFLPKHLSVVSSTSLYLEVMITGIAIFVESN